jgi:D-arabinose 1-dehydrogenase-like Zn-dependent alcohol dehydrogenase
MNMARAIQVTGPHQLRLVELPVRDPRPDEIRIRVEACGVCRSDTFTTSGLFPGLTFPRVPGHEIAGAIDAVGADVSRLRVGDRVGVGWYGGHCGDCPACRRGFFMSCTRGQITGVSFDGGYADYVIVPAQAAARIPAALCSEA